VTASAQYTATAFSKPVRTVFSFILRPERQRRIDESQARWFPTTIVYRTESRYLVDEMVRRIAAAMMRVARSSRAVQSGNLRLYIAYAVAAVIVAVVAAR
jgi:hydrogenase-4 component B